VIATGETSYPVVEWLDDVRALKYSDYWKDEREEREKPFWVMEGDFTSMERYLGEIRLVEQLEACVAVARARFGRSVCGTGCDLGAGTLWAVPHLLRLGRTDRIYCVEYSRHRLTKLGPAVLRHYGVPPAAVVLAVGDLHHLEMENGSVDFTLLSASFHHSDRPRDLLSEIRRILKANGVVFVIGEHLSDPTARTYARHVLKYAAARLPHRAQLRLFGRRLYVDRLFVRPEDLLGGDERLGDHAYTSNQYHDMFTNAGFRTVNLRRRSWPTQAFVLVPAQ